MSFKPSDKQAALARLGTPLGETVLGTQAGGGLGVLGGTVASLADPQLGQALQLAGNAQALLQPAPIAPSPIAEAPIVHAPPAAALTQALESASPLVEKLFIAEHPLAGQATGCCASTPRCRPPRRC